MKKDKMLKLNDGILQEKFGELKTSIN